MDEKALNQGCTGSLLRAECGIRNAEFKFANAGGRKVHRRFAFEQLHGAKGVSFWKGKRMKHNAASLALLAGVAFVHSAMPVSAAETETNPYGAITQKNSFRLLPVVIKANTEVPTPRAGVVLQGFAVIFDRRYALLKIHPAPEPGGAAGDVAVVLGEGDKSDGIEVVQIDGQSGSVLVRNCGADQRLSLEMARASTAR